MIRTDNGATTSAMLYCIIETDKANDLIPMKYLEQLLTVILNHMEDEDRQFQPDAAKTAHWHVLPFRCRIIPDDTDEYRLHVLIQRTTPHVTIYADNSIDQSFFILYCT